MIVGTSKICAKLNSVSKCPHSLNLEMNQEVDPEVDSELDPEVDPEVGRKWAQNSSL